MGNVSKTLIDPTGLHGAGSGDNSDWRDLPVYLRPQPGDGEPNTIIWPTPTGRPPRPGHPQHDETPDKSSERNWLSDEFDRIAREFDDAGKRFKDGIDGFWNSWPRIRQSFVDAGESLNDKKEELSAVGLVGVGIVGGYWLLVAAEPVAVVSASYVPWATQEIGNAIDPCPSPTFGGATATIVGKIREEIND